MERQIFLAVFLLVTSHQSLITDAEAARIEYHDALPVVYLEGDPYELGRQHGELLREPVRQAVGQLLGYFRRYLKVPLVRSLLVNWWLDSAWGQARPFLPEDYREELRGLADGSGVPLKELERLHSIPDRTYACSGLAVWGKAATDGRLIHTRNLDWNIDVGIQRYAVVFVVQPSGKHAYVSAGWAGFIGVLTGVNGQGLSIGQIGAEADDLSYRGMPMVFLMRRVLEESDDLDEAVQLITESPRTVGVNYVLADAQARRAVAVETTRSLIGVFEADDAKEYQVPYARPMRDAVVRADTAMDPAIRGRQIASGGNPKTPGLEPPTGSAYEVRYLKQADGIRAHYGRIDAARAREIAQSVAPDSNVQSVIFAWPRMWVANAEGTVPAAQTTYHELNLEELFRTRSQ